MLPVDDIVRPIAELEVDLQVAGVLSLPCVLKVQEHSGSPEIKLPIISDFGRVFEFVLVQLEAGP